MRVRVPDSADRFSWSTVVLSMLLGFFFSPHHAPPAPSGPSSTNHDQGFKSDLKNRYLCAFSNLSVLYSSTGVKHEIY